MAVAITSAGIDGRPQTGREQVGEQLVGKQLVAVVGQERLDAAFGYQLGAQGGGVEQLTVRVALALHASSLEEPGGKSRAPTPGCSTVS